MSNFKIAKQLPFNILVKRIIKKIFPQQKIDYSIQELRKPASNYTLKSLIDVKGINYKEDKPLIKHYLEHEFDLLGSGWQSRNSEKKLILNTEHLFFAEKLIQYISKEYRFINWQLDVKSGFEFDNNKQFDNQEIDELKNVDVKNCWEIGRLQHLPQMALLAINTQNKRELILEFKNLSLDFIVSNPIGMGIQWACVMDVGIRVSNWLIAYDIFKQIDEENELNDQFTLIFTDSIHRHSEFIFNHLEHKEGAAGNHYLFNLVGLLFASNYLSETNETLHWKDFSEVELEKEIYKQFFNDGGNFEGSTTYHCLSSEAMLYATSLMLRNGRKLDQNYIDLIGRQVQLITDISKNNGEIPQFGDNDSGRLFKFTRQSSLLNYQNVLAGFSALFGGESAGIEKYIVGQIAKNNELPMPSFKRNANHQIRNAKHQLQRPSTTEIKFSKDINTSEIKLYSYPDFGIYMFKSSEFYLSISAIANSKMHHSWGHVHNDKLSFELQVNGEDLVRDPGTFTYSSNPEKRNEFRSTKAHNGIVVKGIEQNNPIGLFYLDRAVKCEVLEIQDLSITLQANYYGVEHIRKFTILASQLIVTDYCNKPFKVNINKFQEYSPNYGVAQILKE